MKTTNNLSILFTAAHEVAKTLIGDSYRQCFSFALKQVHAWARKEPVKASLVGAIEKSVATVVATVSKKFDTTGYNDYHQVVKAIHQHFGVGVVYCLHKKDLEVDLSGWPPLQRLKQVLVKHKGEILSVTFDGITKYWFVPEKGWND